MGYSQKGSELHRNHENIILEPVVAAMDKKHTKRLAALQKRFVLEYPRAKSATAAAIAAGYNEKSAAFMGYSLLTDPRIVQRIDENTDDLADYCERSHENILDELAKLAFSNILDFFDADGILIPLKDLPRDVAAAVKKRKRSKTKNRDGTETECIELELIDKKAALELLGRSLGVWSKRRGHEAGLSFIKSLGRTVGPLNHREGKTLDQSPE